MAQSNLLLYYEAEMPTEKQNSNCSEDNKLKLKLKDQQNTKMWQFCPVIQTNIKKKQALLNEIEKLTGKKQQLHIKAGLQRQQSTINKVGLYSKCK